MTLEYQDVLKSIHVDLSTAERDLSEAESDLDLFERNIRTVDPTYSKIFNEAKNDTQRKLILERAYLSEPNEGVWYELRDGVNEARLKVKALQREYDTVVMFVQVSN